MTNLILTISGDKNEENNVLKNIIDINKWINDMDYQYLVYTNYEMSNTIFSKFTYFNEMFYNLQEKIKEYDFLMLLDGDDEFLPEKIGYINKLLKTDKYDYIHNYAIYDNKNYKWNGINNNNSCITIRTSKINFDFYKNTKSLSDYFLWLSVCSDRKKILDLEKALTLIHNKSYNYTRYADYMSKRYFLRLNDLQHLYEKFKMTDYAKNIKKEYLKYKYILHAKSTINGFPDLFTYLHRKEDTDFFIKREYDLRVK